MAFLALFRLTDLPLFFPFFTKLNQELTQKLKIKKKKTRKYELNWILAKWATKVLFPSKMLTYQIIKLDSVTGRVQSLLYNSPQTPHEVWSQGKSATNQILIVSKSSCPHKMFHVPNKLHNIIAHEKNMDFQELFPLPVHLI